MNYRHAYHAGNFADVFKHLILALLLERLCLKPAPFCVLDTHAGIGRYDLGGPEATKTNEATGGIFKLLEAPDVPEAFQPYLQAVRALNASPDKITLYPGSPRVTRALLRPQDRLVLAELHPDDAFTLKQEFAGDPQTAVHHMDGYLALKAHLPPKEKRGLVLIDPPFEQTNELDRLVEALARAHHRWPTGQYAVWYPIKERAAIWRFHAALEQTGIPKQLIAEITLNNEDSHTQLNGCGMLLINPPWQLDKQLQTLLPVLHAALTTRENGAENGGIRVEWLTAET